MCYFAVAGEESLSSLHFLKSLLCTLFLVNGWFTLDIWLYYQNVCGRKETCTWALFFFLNLVKPHLALYEQRQNASIVIKYKIHVLIMFLFDVSSKGTNINLKTGKLLFFKEFQLGKGFFYISQINWKTWILASSSFYHVTAGSQRSEKFGCRPRWIFFFYSSELLWG